MTTGTPDTAVLDPYTPLYNLLIRERRYGEPIEESLPIFGATLHDAHNPNEPPSDAQPGDAHQP